MLSFSLNQFATSPAFVLMKSKPSDTILPMPLSLLNRSLKNDFNPPYACFKAGTWSMTSPTLVFRLLKVVITFVTLSMVSDTFLMAVETLSNTRYTPSNAFWMARPAAPKKPLYWYSFSISATLFFTKDRISETALTKPSCVFRINFDAAVSASTEDLKPLEISLPALVTASMPSVKSPKSVFIFLNQPLKLSLVVRIVRFSAFAVSIMDLPLASTERLIEPSLRP